MTGKTIAPLPSRITPARRRAPRALLLAAALLCAPLAHAAGWDVDALMRALARHGSGQATFVETKTLAMLDEPIESSGELRFSAPDFMEMRTLKPKPQTLVLQGDQLTVELDGRSRQLSLNGHPEIGALVASIRATLNGDRRALEQDYQVALDGDAAHWTLVLVPRAAKARAQVREIRIGGRRGRVRSIAVQQSDGDSSLMTIRERAAQ